MHPDFQKSLHFPPVHCRPKSPPSGVVLINRACRDDSEHAPKIEITPKQICIWSFGRGVRLQCNTGFSPRMQVVNIRTIIPTRSMGTTCGHWMVGRSRNAPLQMRVTLDQQYPIHSNLPNCWNISCTLQRSRNFGRGLNSVSSRVIGYKDKWCN